MKRSRFKDKKIVYLALTLSFLFSSFFLLFFPSFADILVKDDFNLPVLNLNRWKVANHTKDVKISVQAGMLAFYGTFLQAQEKNAYVSANASLQKGPTYSLSVKHSFSGSVAGAAGNAPSEPEVMTVTAPEAHQGELIGKPGFASPSGSPPASFIGFFNVKENKGLVFHINPTVVFAVVRFKGKKEFHKIQEITEGSFHTYKVVYATSSGKVEFYMDGALVYTDSADFQELIPLLGVTAWEGNADKKINSARFDDFVLERK